LLVGLEDGLEVSLGGGATHPWFPVTCMVQSTATFPDASTADTVTSVLPAGRSRPAGGDCVSVMAEQSEKTGRWVTSGRRHPCAATCDWGQTRSSGAVVSSTLESLPLTIKEKEVAKGIAPQGSSTTVVVAGVTLYVPGSKLVLA
jgi:hypothetical protein